MKHSVDRILTTHAGRLDGPAEFRNLTTGTGGAPDWAKLGPRIHAAMVDVVRRQAETGVDVIGDGELGKTGYGIGYYGRRLSGLEARAVAPGEPGFMSLRTGERLEFAEFYKEYRWVSPTERVICTGPVTYVGLEEVKQDIARFRAALAEANVNVQETFMCVLSPGWLEHFFYNEHYPDDESYLRALADACTRIAEGGTNKDDLWQLARWSADVRGRGACKHPDGAVIFLSSALAVFAREFAAHAPHQARRVA